MAGNHRDELVNRVCFRISDRYLKKDPGTVGWWGPILGRVTPGLTVAVRGAWPLQRHFIAKIVAALGGSDEATLRGPAPLLDRIIEEALAIRADISMERIRTGKLGNAEWARLAVASGQLDGASFKVEHAEMAGVELNAGARWCFGMPHSRAGIEVKVVDDDAGVHLEILDGRKVPPTWRRKRLRLAGQAVDVTARSKDPR